MAFRSQDRQIGDSTFKVYELPATQGLAMFMQLAKMVGPAMGVLVDAAKASTGGASLANVLGASISGDVFGAAMESLATRLDEQQVQAMIAKLREKTEVDLSGSGNFVQLSQGLYDTIFAGKIMALLTWLRFALEVQFADFLPALASRAPRALADAAPGQPQA
jgi:hypothetical protein